MQLEIMFGPWTEGVHIESVGVAELGWDYLEELISVDGIRRITRSSGTE